MKKIKKVHKDNEEIPYYQPIPVGWKVICIIEHVKGDPLKTVDRELYFYRGNYRNHNYKKHYWDETTTYILKELEQNGIDINDRSKHKRGR